MTARILPHRTKAEAVEAAVRKIERDIKWRVRLYRGKRWLRDHRLEVALVSAIAFIVWWL